MNIRELITALEALRENLGDEAIVLLAQQPRWPFEYSVGEIIGVESEDGETVPTIYIGEGKQLGYLRGEVVHELGWR